MRLVISDPKTGKSYQKEIPSEQEATVSGKKIGEELDGGLFGAAGYKVQLTGGSNKSGFPMRNDVEGPRMTKILLTEGIGFHTKRKGERRRRMVQGNTYSQEIMQVNCKVTAWGSTPLETLFPKQEKKS